MSSRFSEFSDWFLFLFSFTFVNIFSDSIRPSSLKHIQLKPYFECWLPIKNTFIILFLKNNKKNNQFRFNKFVFLRKIISFYKRKSGRMTSYKTHEEVWHVRSMSKSVKISVHTSWNVWHCWLRIINVSKSKHARRLLRWAKKMVFPRINEPNQLHRVLFCHFRMIIKQFEIYSMSEWTILTLLFHLFFNRKSNFFINNWSTVIQLEFPWKVCISVFYFSISIGQIYDCRFWYFHCYFWMITFVIAWILQSERELSLSTRTLENWKQLPSLCFEKSPITSGTFNL